MDSNKALDILEDIMKSITEPFADIFVFSYLYGFPKLAKARSKFVYLVMVEMNYFMDMKDFGQSQRILTCNIYSTILNICYMVLIRFFK